MTTKSMKILLLVEDNPGDARLLREMLNEQGPQQTELTHVQRLSDAEKYLAENAVDLILLDLGLPDAHGLGAVRRAHACAPRVPLVVLTGMDDEVLAAQALQEGAQDYLIKGQIEARSLRRALRYAIERKIMEEALLWRRSALKSRSTALATPWLAPTARETSPFSIWSRRKSPAGRSWKRPAGPWPKFYGSWTPTAAKPS